MARAIISQRGVEAFHTATDDEARVTQHGVEAFYAWSSSGIPGTVVGAGVSQYGVEAFFTPTDDLVRVSQYGVEAFFTDTTEPSGGGSSPVTTSFGYST